MKAFIFPGQGAQYPGMGQEAFRAYPEAREIFERADDALGFSLSRLCFEGPREALVLTENTQPALLTSSIAVYKVLESRMPPPDFVAGHSLGEYSALVAAKSLNFADAVRLVRKRGQFMQDAVPVGEGAMAAILGLGLRQVEDICRDAAENEVVSPANINSQDQIVIAGHTAAVNRACRLCRERNSGKAIPLSVSAPFHCELMRPAQERLSQFVSDMTFNDLAIPLINNVDATQIHQGQQAKDGVVRQVSSAVRWSEGVEQMLQKGVQSFVEVGPGKILTGLVRRIADRAGFESIQVRNLEKAQDLEAYV